MNSVEVANKMNETSPTDVVNVPFFVLLSSEKKMGKKSAKY